jgi:hypothetical protein
VIDMRVASDSTEIRIRREIIGCALVGSLGILLLDALILRLGVGYGIDDKILLYSVAVNDIMVRLRDDSFFRPLEFLILLAANNVYLPLWLGASLLCVVGATILSALACEVLFERQLPKAGWWVLGIANPLLFYLVSDPFTVSQALCNLLFAGVMLAFISELRPLRDQLPSGWRADHTAAFLNLMAAALFFAKETGVAAAVLLPAATTLIRLKRRQLSPIFLFSMLLPIGAAIAAMLIKLVGPVSQYLDARARYGLKLNPITWGENFIITLAFPVTPLPSSFIAFDLLRPLWVVVALGSVTIFVGLLLRESLRQPKIVLPLLIVAASCAPMILIHSSELYSTMIAPFAVSIVLLFSVPKMRWPSLAYGLLLYAASFANGILYSLGPDFNPLGLQRLPYSIYTGKDHQQVPTCPIGATAHVAIGPVTEKPTTASNAWEGTAVTCVR